MNILKHIKECLKESSAFIVGCGIGILLYSTVGSKDIDYFYGWYMWSCGVLVTSSYFIRKKDVHSYFQAAYSIKYKIWKFKIWLRETLCKHDYQLHVHEHSQRLMYSEVDEIRQCCVNKVWGTNRDIKVSCAKCGKVIVEEKNIIGYDIDWEWRKKADRYILERRKAIEDLEPRHAEMRKEALRQMRSVETEIRWKVKERLEK